MRKLNQVAKKYIFFAIVVVIALFVSYESDKVYIGDPLYGSDTLRCAFALNTSMYSQSRFPEEFNYELLKKFSSKIKKSLYVENVKDGDVFDLLNSSEFDMAVYNVTDDFPEDFEEQFAHSAITLGDMAWIVSRDRHSLLVAANKWLSMFSNSNEYVSLVSNYFRSYNVDDFLKSGEEMCQLTPYDNLIKKYSQKNGLDWRLVASIVYQESRFHFMAVSHRNAQGLMQLRPQTAVRFGVEDLIDPEENIKAGTKYLKYLYNLFDSNGAENGEDVMKLTLAAYNAGEGRIATARKIADSLGYDKNEWASVKQVFKDIPNFSGRETSNYVETVLAHYEKYIKVTENEE